MSKGFNIHLTKSPLQLSVFPQAHQGTSILQGKEMVGRGQTPSHICRYLGELWQEHGRSQGKARPLGARRAVCSASSHHAGLCPSETYCQLKFSLSSPVVCTRSYPELK